MCSPGTRSDQAKSLVGLKTRAIKRLVPTPRFKKRFTLEERQMIPIPPEGHASMQQDTAPPIGGVHLRESPGAT